MIPFDVVLVMGLLFLLRLALPIIILLVFGYELNRLVTYWNRNIEF